MKRRMRRFSKQEWGKKETRYCVIFEGSGGFVIVVVYGHMQYSGSAYVKFFGLY